MVEPHSSVPMNRVMLVLASGIAAISFAAILIRWCAAPPLVIAFYRLLFAALFFWITSKSGNLTQLRNLPLKTLQWGGLAGIALALHFATWITSLNHTSVANSVVLVATSPIFVALGARFILGESARPLLYWGLLLAFAGATVITLQDAEGSNTSFFGNLLALAGALFAGVYFLIGRKLRQELDTAPYVTLCYSAAAIVLLLGTLLWRLPLFDYSAQTFLTFLALALVPQVIGHTSFNWALKHLSAPVVSIALLGEPIGASILAFVFFKEELGTMTLFGGSLTLFGVALAIFSERGKA
ncbi:DMT family transporter [candidate division KSB1 bacterium]|nr:DMT family transporter [candidate division KSB1 bacterium]